MKLEALTAILGELEKSIQYGALDRQEYLPEDVYESKITVDRLKVAFASRLSFGSTSLATNVAQHARKVFAVLSFIGEPQLIEGLWKLGLKDEHLPLTIGADAETRDKLVARDGKRFNISAWKMPIKAKLFVSTQQLVLAPVFDTTGKHFPLELNCAMPFLNSDEIGGGNYGSVYKCEIHPSHQRGLKVEDGKTYAAVKHFKLRSAQDAFKQERTNLEKLKDLDHRHMLRYYATCQLGKDYYAIFPWADGGNLWEYWKDCNVEPRTPELAVWIFQQLLGLAGALEALHKRNCRHGDLKPENILRFNKATDPILVVGDVGVSRFHTNNTLARDKGTETRATTPSYQAPEVDGAPNKARSRTFDIWSFGCIALEFVIWYLWDFNSVRGFQQKRVAPDRYCYCYERNESGDMVVHPKVTDAFSSLLADPRCTEDTAWGRLVILIRDRLLQVDVLQRAKAEELVTRLQAIVGEIETPDPSAFKTTATAPAKPEIFQSKNLPAIHTRKDSLMPTTPTFSYSVA